MDHSDRSFDRSDLILSWLSMRQYRKAHEDLRGYHESACGAFMKAFGMNLEATVPSPEMPDEKGLHALFMQVVGCYERTGSPFDAFYCSGTEVTDLYRKYGEPLRQAAANQRNLHMMILLELAERIWGGQAPHRVSRSELENHGHPGWKAPDPVDYW